MAVVTPSRAPGDRAATGLCCWVLCQVGEQGSRVFAGGGGGGLQQTSGGCERWKVLLELGSCISKGREVLQRCWEPG